jgi:hypothetical protein
VSNAKTACDSIDFINSKQRKSIMASSPASAPGREAWVEFNRTTETGLVGLVLSVRKGSGGNAAATTEALPTLTGFVTVSPDGQAMPAIFPWVNQTDGEEQRMFIFPMHPETGGNQYIERMCFYNDSQDRDCANVEVVTTNDVDPSVRLFYHYRTTFSAVAKPFCMGGGRMPQASPCAQQPALILQRMTFHVNLPSGSEARATLLPFRKGIDVIMGPMPETYPEIQNREAVDRARVEPEPVQQMPATQPQQQQQQLALAFFADSNNSDSSLVNPFAVDHPQKKTVNINPIPTEIVILSATASSDSSSAAVVVAQIEAVEEPEENARANGFLVSPSAWSCTHWMGVCILLGAMMFFGWLGYAITEHHRGLRTRRRSTTTTSRSAVGFSSSAATNPLLGSGAGSGGYARRLTLQSALAEE